MKQTVAILPGMVSGKHTTRRLRKLLRQAGYTITDDPAKANVILAHSAGCLWLPQPFSGATFILVDPPYWPGRTVRERIKARSRSNGHFLQYGVPWQGWLSRQLWGIYYAVANPRRTIYILRHLATYDLENSIREQQTVLVRNEHDDWLTPELTALQSSFPQVKTITMPGEHDDFNYHPERYVDLLQSKV